MSAKAASAGTLGRREEKADKTRRALLQSAAVLVGKVGYEKASIIKITSGAGVANGTFYNYFASRQELFNELLPTIGEQLVDYIKLRVSSDSTGWEREMERMAASLDFFIANPGFVRLLNESEVFAPKAFMKHMKRFVTSYERGLKQHLDHGELNPWFQEADIIPTVYILLGARNHLMMYAAHSKKRVTTKVTSSLLDTYMKLIRFGLFPNKLAARCTPDINPQAHEA